MSVTPFAVCNAGPMSAAVIVDRRSHTGTVREEPSSQPGNLHSTRPARFEPIGAQRKKPIATSGAGAHSANVRPSKVHPIRERSTPAAHSLQRLARNPTGALLDR